MIVFKYFVEKMDIFALRMNALARMEHIHVGNEDDEMTFVS